jgi:hypothetical protein
MTKTISAALLILTLATGLHAQTEFSPQTMLKPRATGLLTVPVNINARAAYEMLGDRAGINMVFAQSFQADIPVALRVEGQTFFEAMDRLSQQTGTFWSAWDSKTVILGPDTQQFHRDIEPIIFKVFYLDGSSTIELATRIHDTLRARIKARSILLAQESQAIVVKGTVADITAAEQIISEMSLRSLPIPSAAASAAPDNSTMYLLVAENGKARQIVASTRAHMGSMFAGSVSIDLNQPAKAVYEDLAARAGLNVIFDRQMREKPAARFHTESLDLANTLDLLAFQTGTFWQPLNESTIYVMDDNQQNRRDREMMKVKVIYLPEMASVKALLETLNILRTSMGFRGIFHSEKQKAIIIKDTPLRILLAEKIISDLNKKFGQPTTVAVATETSSLYAENNWVLGNAAEARPQLEVKLRNKTTVRLRETPKRAFEALAGLAGLQVAFDSRFTDSAEFSFNATNVDILDAFDLLAWQTRQFWQVVDQHTIRVIPDSQVARRDLEPMIQKTIVPASPADAASLLNILRTTFGLRDAKVDEKNNILVRDTADNVAIAEKLVEVLGKGATQQ